MNRKDRCADPSPYDSAEALQLAMDTVNHPVVTEAPDPNRVVAQINLKLAAMGRIDWNDGSGSHYLAIYGYIPASGANAT